MKDSYASLLAAPELVAPRLLGSVLVRTFPDDTQTTARIVETEAYHQSDAASHSYRGSTPRTEVMFGPAGFCYVYFTYGMHYCMNVVTGPAGEGSAVLIRALEPVAGVPPDKRTDGPARLCYALQVDKAFNGHDLRLPPLQLQLCKPLDDSLIVRTTRIGITKDTQRLWRFYIRDNPFVSKP